MKKLFLNCLITAVLSMFFLPNTYGQSESGGLLSKLMMMMMKNRRRTYVPFPIPFNPLSYSSIIPLSYPATTLPIGGYPNYRSSLIGSLGSGGHLGPLSHSLGGIGPLSFGIPFLSSLRGDHKFLSRSSQMYEPTVASSSIVPSIAVVASPVSAAPLSPLITNPTAAINNNLLPAHLTAPSNQSPLISPLGPPSAAITNAISNSNSLSLTNSSPLTIPTLSNSNLFNSHLYSSANNPSSILTSSSSNQQNSLLTNFSSNNSTNAYSNSASNGNNLDKTMTGSQGELIKQELKEHHLNNIRIQYLKSLRDHLIRDQQLKEQYLKELTKKSIVYPYLDMYDEINKKKK